ncbi:glycine cleavage system protein GcvH [Clostridium hydrogeniformans]|uniref:glycine cleavage system protein GcvH n=1 Tax=Clostridium hydrogeniformans TaxID=349933 RepID=UPI000482BFB4|nr:glycine cleavage system protein GcvH [Clostridium hydrogeniformans]
MAVLENLLYTKDHEWIKVEGSKAYIGVTDHAQKLLGDIVYVELPEVDTDFEKGDVLGVIESVKAAADIYIAISGTVVEINEELIDNPAAINEAAYDNWMIAIEIKDENELNELLSPKDYEEICNEEE